MKKTSLVLIILLGLAAGFSAPNYIASVDVLDSALTAGDTLTLYGFIDYEAGQGNPYDASALSLSYSASSSSKVLISGIQYLSNYDNPENLLLDGAFTASVVLPQLYEGVDYIVELRINGELKDEALFSYNSIKKESNLYITRLEEYAGLLSTGYKIDNKNETQNITYTVSFKNPNINSEGSALYPSQLFVQNKTSNSTAIRFPSPFSQGANVLIARVNSAIEESTGNAVESQKLPLSVLELVSSGEAVSLDRAGKLAMSNCAAKENDASVCEFSVLNNGSYPSIYSFEIISSIANASVEFTAGVINPGESALGKVIVSAKLAELGTQSLTLKLKHSDSVLDSKQITVAVSARDKIHKIDLRIFGLNRYVLQGDSVNVSFTLNNTGDFDENIRVIYSVNGGTEMFLGGLFTLKKGQTVSRNIDLTGLISGLSSNAGFEISAENEDAEVIGSISSGLAISELSYAPIVSWNKAVVRIEAGNYSYNHLTVRNNGNTPDTYIIIVGGDFSTLKETVSLQAGESKTIQVPVVSEINSKGTYQVSASACSSFSTECSIANYSLIVYELPVYGNAAVQALNTSLNLEKGQAGIFEILVTNNNGDAREYKIDVTGFGGEVRISPESKLLLSGKSEKFLIYLLPDEVKTQTAQYQVLESNVAIKTENLTISYGSSFLTGFVTAGSASNVIVSIMGLGLLSALIVFGIRAFNQSKTELKYWK
jgi:hypothetical protein